MEALGDYTKQNGMGGVCSTHREIRNTYKILVGKPQGMQPLGKPGHRWEGNIKIHLTEVWCEGTD